MTMLTVKRLARDLTVGLWKNPENYKFLDPISQMMAEHYLEIN